MIVKLNKYGYIESYNIIPTEEILDGWIVIEDIEGNPCDYQYINSKLIYNPIPKEKPLGVALEYDGDVWHEMAPLEVQVENYKKLIIEKTKEFETEKLAGFGNSNLELELNELKKIHLEKSHELALQIENRLREV